ncbi:MAG: hypothetical protein RSE26_02540 [Malacoplasma sp.]
MIDNKIVVCSVKKIEEDRIFLDCLGTEFICHDNQVSDYKVNLFAFFVINKKYKFILDRENNISYKKFRPKLIKNKKRPIPTISHYFNLEDQLLNSLNNMDCIKGSHKEA